MSDAYEIDGVKITPASGGYYDLAHASLPDGTERVRGKENADKRAGEVAKSAASGEGTMSGNADINELTPAQTATAAEGAAAIAPQDAPKGDDDATKLANAEARNAEMQKQIDELLKAAKPIVTTVEAVEGADATSAIPMVAPREYNGKMDDKTKAVFKKAGIQVHTIVLEENESIPPTGLFIGHNGRSYMIAPGEEVDVPDFLLNVLDDAIMSAPIVDSKSAKVLGYRNRSKYPYRKV